MARPLKPSASGAGSIPAGCTKVPCPAEIAISLVDDGGDPAIAAGAVMPRIQVSNLVTNVELPAGYNSPSKDRDNVKVQLIDGSANGPTIPAARVTIEMLKPGLTHTTVAGDTLPAIAGRYGVRRWRTIYNHPKNAAFKAKHPDPKVITAGQRLWIPTPHSPRPFAPPRTLQVELRRVGITNIFRSQYLRLVVDDEDQRTNRAQTLLADWDPADPNVDILGQVARVTYRSSSGRTISADAMVGGAKRSFVRIAVHVLRTRPGGPGVVTPDQAATRVHQWVRRALAQMSMAPYLLIVREVDPLENLISISNDHGRNAAGGAASRISFRIESKRKRGVPPVIQNIGPYSPPAGQPPIQTANALAALIGAAPTFKVRTVQNPPTLEPLVGQGSADLIITDPAGGRIRIANLVATDATQTVRVGKVNPMKLEGWARPPSPRKPAPRNWVVGSIQQRTLLQAYDTGSDRVDLFVVGAIDPSARGQAMMPGSIYAAGRQAIAQVTRSAFVIMDTMDGTANHPYTLVHEMGHGLLDAIHAVGDPTQVMRSGTSPTHAVGGSKRYSESAVNFDDPAIGIVQERRWRAIGAPVLTPFS